MEEDLIQTMEELNEVKEEIVQLKAEKKKQDKINNNLMEYFKEFHKKSGEILKKLKTTKDEDSDEDSEIVMKFEDEE
jgi:hypothetical protein